MRLVSRLLASHAAPVAVVSLALLVVLGALVRMTQLSRELGERELRALANEGSIHQAAWGVDLALRGAPARCRAGDTTGVRDELAATTHVLESRLASTPDVSVAIGEPSRSYHVIAEEVLAGETCAAALEVQERRAQLDATLTTAWVERLAELHTAARVHDEEVGRLGTQATWLGALLAIAGFALAMLVARTMAREVSQPLADLSQTAQRLARGDFSRTVAASGPAEIVELADELERMRIRLAELEALKEGFLASVSHELRTPLSKIREALALLSDGAAGPLEERQKRVVQIASTACEREVRLVTTLLDFSRLRAGGALRRKGGSSIDAVLATAVAEERADARGRVEVELTSEGEAPRAALDPEMLERAIANLVRNAVSVSRPGQVVRVQREIDTSDSPPSVRIVVIDDGPGVPIELRDTIFQPFVTGAVARSPKGVGVGLGLALAREVAVAHGGELRLDTEHERGARFVLTIPLEGASGARVSTRPPAPPSGRTRESDET
jgi:two-component system sensor histidine kinase GlrK